MWVQSRGIPMTNISTIAAPIASCRAFRRISLEPKGGGFGLVSCEIGSATAARGVTVSMLELEVDECAAAGGAEAQVERHADGQPDAHVAACEDMAQV